MGIYGYSVWFIKLSRLVSSPSKAVGKAQVMVEHLDTMVNVISDKDLPIRMNSYIQGVFELQWLRSHGAHCCYEGTLYCQHLYAMIGSVSNNNVVILCYCHPNWIGELYLSRAITPKASNLLPTCIVDDGDAVLVAFSYNKVAFFGDGNSQRT